MRKARTDRRMLENGLNLSLPEEAVSGLSPGGFSFFRKKKKCSEKCSETLLTKTSFMLE